MLYTTLGLLALGLVNTQAAPLQQQGEQAQIKHRAVSRVARRFARADGLIDFGQVEADAQRTRSKYAKSSALYKRQLAEREADPYAFLNEVARRQEEQRFGKRAPADNYAIVPLGATFSQGSIVGYRSNVSVGTPAQELTVVFDTGSPDFWLPGPNSGENVFKDFDPSQSSTAKDLNGQFVEQYGLGAVSGGIYSDVVSVSNLTVENQAFGVADQTTSNFNQPLGSAGLLGMSFNVLSVSFAGNNWIQNLVFNNKLASPLFSMWLGAALDLDSNPLDSGIAYGGGELCLGCVDSSRFSGSFVSTPLVFPGYWEAECESMGIDGSNVQGTQTFAAIDSGTSLFYVTPEVFQGLESIPGFGTYELSRTTTILTAPCDTSENFDFNFAGNAQVTANLSYFVLGQVDRAGTTCGLGISSVEGVTDPLGNPMSIFGDVFMQSFVTVFSFANNGSISFADANPATSSEVSVSQIAPPTQANTQTPFGTESQASAFSPTFTVTALPTLTQSAQTLTVTGSL